MSEDIFVEYEIRKIIDKCQIEFTKKKKIIKSLQYLDVTLMVGVNHR